QDDGTEDVAIVDQAFVQRYLADRNPLGQVLDFWGGDKKTVVGVINNSKHMSLYATGYTPSVYVPVTSHCSRSMTFFIRTQGDPLQWADAGRKAIWETDPAQPILYTETMDHLVSQSVSLERFCMILLSLMAAVALLMASVGLYGIMAFTVSERRNEIGIRMALGAEAKAIFALVTGKALALTVSGLTLGLAGAFLISRFLGSMLYNTNTYDPVTYVLVPILLLAVAMLACWIPARRAAKIDPMEALRYE
ncbi:FtsX-like permease family protein, partial [Planctomycetota bacterium]